MNLTNTTEILREGAQILQQEADAILKVRNRLGQSLPVILKMMLECRGHLLITGAGTSRAVAARFAHLLACCGTPALPFNAADALHGGSGAITGQDVVYVISKGGRSREINELVDIARARGAKIIAHTEDPESPLASKSDVVLSITAEGDVDPFGMIATGSSLVNSAGSGS